MTEDREDSMETLGWIASVLGGDVLEAPEDHLDDHWSSLTTDSRKAGPGAVFAAIVGERLNGHDFAAAAARSGAACLLVEKRQPVDAPQIVVENTRRACGLIARAWRRRFHIPVVAVGGSNGKTTTTQMLRGIFEAQWGTKAVHATQGNFNNDIGVPHTLLGLTSAHKAAVVEAGMNHRGEMARLADWIGPTAVLMTNAQREHQAYLETVAEAAFENGLLIAALPEDGVAVYPADDPCADVWASYALARGVKAYTYATAAGVAADVRGEELPDGSLRLLAEGVDVVIPLQTLGAHNLHNAAGAAAAALAQGVSLKAVKAGLSGFKPLSGRGERFESPAGFTLIDDAYNCNPDSAIASIATLAEAAPARIFLFGDMAELGRESEVWHAEVGGAAKTLGIDYFWAAGPLSRHAVDAFGDDGIHGRWFKNRDELVAHLTELPLKGATIAVKASHSAGFGGPEGVVAALKNFCPKNS